MTLAIAIAVAGAALATGAPGVPGEGVVAAAAGPPALPLVDTYDRTLTRFRGDGTTEAFAAPAVGDLDGDGAAEIVLGGMDGRLRILRASDRALISTVDLGDAAIEASPLLVDLDGDDHLDVLVSTVGGTASGLRGVDVTGRTLFSVTESAAIPGVSTHGFFGTPAVGDLDGDGTREVVAASWDHRIYAWRLDGTLRPGFPRFLYDTPWSSPALADLDGDGGAEIVMGGDMYVEPGAPYPAGGMLWVLRRDATDLPGYPRNLPGETIWSAPLVTDLDVDGDPDIVVGTGHFYAGIYNEPTRPASRLVHAFDARSGAPLPGWPVSMPGTTGSSPAVGDLAGDHRPEVVISSQGGWVAAFDYTGHQLWLTCVRGGWADCEPGAPTHGSPVIADADADGRQEVVVGLEGRLFVLSGATGQPESVSPFAGTTYAPGSTPTVATVGSQTWILHDMLVEASGAGSRGVGDIERLMIWRSATAPASHDWPTFKGGMDRSGRDDAQRFAGRFADDDGTLAEPAIDALADAGVVAGCERFAPRYCPRSSLTRGQMASLLARALDLPAATADYFDDDDGSVHETNINRVAEAGVAQGIGDRRFAPGVALTRAQAASLLARAFDLAPSAVDHFTDDDGSVHEAAIDAGRAAGVIAGCGPTTFCPSAVLTRAQMAMLMARALGLVDTVG